MKLYITGPQTDVPGYNFTAFDAAAAALDFLGHDPISPVDHDREMFPGIEQTPEFLVGERVPESVHCEMIAWDLRQVLDADGIVRLPGDGGRGSRIERAVATMTGKRIFHLVTVGSGIGAPWIEGAELRLIEPPKPVVVGLSGYGQCGKSTAGLALAALGFTEIGTADAIREVLFVLNPRIKVKGHWTALRTHVERVGWEVAKALPAVREMMQLMGTEMADIIDPDMWAAVVRRRIEHAYDGWDVTPEPARFVVTSVRRRLDAKSVVNMGGEVWRIERDGFGPINDHPNETELDEWPFDARIFNDGEDLINYTNVVAQAAALRGLLDTATTERLLAFFDADTALADTAS